MAQFFGCCRSSDASRHSDLEEPLAVPALSDNLALKLRSAKDEPMPAEKALELLKAGNQRFREGKSTTSRGYVGSEGWKHMVTAGQSPFAAVLGCADSRSAVELLFDAQPGDIFVLRNAGNTCSHAEGSMVGSLEFCISALRTRLILVLGHTHCGALKGAANAWHQKKVETGPAHALELLLQGLVDVADAAAKELGPGATEEAVAKHLVQVNVMRTVEFLLEFSQSIREAVRQGTVQVQGAVFDIETGAVKILGPSPRQADLLLSQAKMPRICKALAAPPAALKLRSAKDEPVPAATALQSLKDGNKRFVEGASFVAQRQPGAEDWSDFVEAGQSPFAAVLGCADSRCPVESLFDAKPGDIFVCRNAGNTCCHAEGSMVGSLEFCISALRTRLVIVLGHTHCGALKGATKALYSKNQSGPGMALEVLLQGLVTVAELAAEELGSGAKEADVAKRAVPVNVMRTVEFLLQYSKPIREGVRSGLVEVHGAIYDIETGSVEFLGPSKRQKELLNSQETLPPSCKISISNVGGRA